MRRHAPPQSRRGFITLFIAATLVGALLFTWFVSTYGLSDFKALLLSVAVVEVALFIIAVLFTVFAEHLWMAVNLPTPQHKNPLLHQNPQEKSHLELQIRRYLSQINHEMHPHTPQTSTFPPRP